MACGRRLNPDDGFMLSVEDLSASSERAWPTALADLEQSVIVLFLETVAGRLKAG